MKQFKKYYRFLFLLIIAEHAFAENYFVASGGQDSNSGTSASSPWQTITRVNKQFFKPGDSIFFRRSDVFTGSLVIRYSGTKLNPVVFCAYGKGDNPLLTGAVTLNTFQQYNNVIQFTSIENEVKAFFVNNQLQTIARFPNKGYQIMQHGFGSKVTFSDTTLTHPGDYWKDATIRFRTFDWEIRTSKVVEFSKYKLTISDSSTNELGKGWGYYLENKMELLDTTGEWFYNMAEKKLYIYGSVAGKKEAVIQRDAVTVANGISNIAIKNLTIEKYGRYGILLEGTNKNIIVSDNVIRKILTTGIHLNSHTSNCSIENNRLSDICGRGVYAEEPAYLSVKKNNIQRIGMVPGYGISGVNGMVGIAVTNIESKKTSKSTIAHHNHITQNTLDSIGYVAIRMDGAWSLLDKNRINHALLMLSDGAAIYCFATGPNYTHHNAIARNIVSNTMGSNEGTPDYKKQPISNSIYIDNYSYNILVKNNTVYNASGSGVHINSGAHDNTVTGNTIFNCTVGLSVAEWGEPNTTYKNSFTKNKIVLFTKEQRAVELMNFLIPDTKRLASFQYNEYMNIVSDTLMKERYADKARKNTIINNYTFRQWQNIFGYDKTGLQMTKPMGELTLIPTLITNDSSLSRQFDGQRDGFKDAKGKNLYNLVIAPYSSAIVFIKSNE